MLFMLVNPAAKYFCVSSLPEKEKNSRFWSSVIKRLKIIKTFLIDERVFLKFFQLVNFHYIAQINF